MGGQCDHGHVGTYSDRRRVVLVVFEQVQALDLVGPLEVFAGAARIVKGAYTVEIATIGQASVASSSGLAVVPTRDLWRWRGDIDTLVVAGGPGVAEAENDMRLIAALTRAASRSRRIASICTGALLLARAGLLDGRAATTHWAYCDELARRFPQVRVDADRIFVNDGPVWTSAGVTAGMDLALALVENDLGRDVALEVARWLVMFLQRPGGQSQFSTHLTAPRADRQPLRELQTWIADNVTADLRVEALARRASMSPRHFARAFRCEIGMTPATFVELSRVETARHALSDGRSSIKAVAARCGFGTPETMRRAFHRRLGINPAEYRDRFRSATDSSI
jgi:transcriptional regulator GlxA family with amidase domain